MNKGERNACGVLSNLEKKGAQRTGRASEVIFTAEWERTDLWSVGGCNGGEEVQTRKMDLSFVSLQPLSHKFLEGENSFFKLFYIIKHTVFYALKLQVILQTYISL